MLVVLKINAISTKKRLFHQGYCKGYKITKICLRHEKYLCGKCIFDNKIICKNAAKLNKIYLYINKNVILFKTIIETKQK